MRHLISDVFVPNLHSSTPRICHSVWSPYLKGDCEAIEKVQRIATRLVPSISNLRYEDRLSALGLTTLIERRKRGDLIQLYKFMHGFEVIQNNNCFPLVKNNLRGHCFKYYKEIAHTSSREHFFYNRIANLWNSLPNEVVSAQSVNGFKAALDCWLSSNQAKVLS